MYCCLVATSQDLQLYTAMHNKQYTDVNKIIKEDSVYMGSITPT